MARNEASDGLEPLEHENLKDLGAIWVVGIVNGCLARTEEIMAGKLSHLSLVRVS